MTAEEVKETKKEIVGPIRGGTMKRTLKELEKLNIDLKDLFSIESLTINLSWDKLIKLVNYNAGKVVLSWEHTFEEALEIIGIFLM